MKTSQREAILVAHLRAATGNRMLESHIARQLKWVSRIFGIHIQESMARVRDHGE
jgi:hypothetical protein